MVKSIVVGTDGSDTATQAVTGAKRFMLGSVPNKVSHRVPCSVLIIRTA
jgi:nucleotide-binding universal stress UspA family protein